VAEISVPFIDGGATPDATHDLADRDELDRAFRRLTDNQRAILALVYFADLSLADVSAVLGIPLGTTKSRLNRAIAALRAALAADERLIQLLNGRTA
jgi:RNA polymerase sigma factor (sigma-70 family)